MSVVGRLHSAPVACIPLEAVFITQPTFSSTIVSIIIDIYHCRWQAVPEPEPATRGRGLPVVGRLHSAPVARLPLGPVHADAARPGVWARLSAARRGLYHGPGFQSQCSEVCLCVFWSVCILICLLVCLFVCLSVLVNEIEEVLLTRALGPKPRGLRFVCLFSACLSMYLPICLYVCILYVSAYE